MRISREFPLRMDSQCWPHSAALAVSQVQGAMLGHGRNWFIHCQTEISKVSNATPLTTAHQSTEEHHSWRWQAHSGCLEIEPLQFGDLFLVSPLDLLQLLFVARLHLSGQLLLCEIDGSQKRGPVLHGGQLRNHSRHWGLRPHL